MSLGPTACEALPATPRSRSAPGSSSADGGPSFLEKMKRPELEDVVEEQER